MKVIKRLLIQFKKGKEKEQMSFNQPLKNPATNSSFEVVEQVESANDFIANARMVVSSKNNQLQYY